MSHHNAFSRITVFLRKTFLCTAAISLLSLPPVYLSEAAAAQTATGKSQSQSQNVKKQSLKKAAKTQTSRKQAAKKQSAKSSSKKQGAKKTAQKKSQAKSGASKAAPKKAAPAPQVSDEYVSYDERALGLREAYRQAKERAQAGDEAGVRNYTEGVLKGYPLNVYLEYYLLMSDMGKGRYREAMDFIQKGGDQELALLVKDGYSDRLLRDGEPRLALRMIGDDPYPNLEPSALKVKEKARECRFHEAALRSGQGNGASISFAEQIYVSPASYPDACAGLLEAWSAKGYRSKAAAGRRFVNVYLRPRSTLESVENAAQALEGDELRSALEAVTVFNMPESYAALDDRRASVLAFMRYARQNPNDAAAALESFIALKKPTSVERNEILLIISGGRLGSQSTLEDLMWVDDNLPAALWTRDLIEQRLRRAIWFKQWKYIPPLVDALGERGATEANWMYWKGRGLLNTGHKEEGRALLRQAASDRSFFGFLSAQLLGIHAHYGNKSLTRQSPLKEGLTEIPAVARFLELYAMNDPARFVEWREIARNTDDETALSMGEWALRTGNDQLAIAAVTAGERWDALDYRFPLSFNSLYRVHAANSGVSLAYLYGISRQESMMNPVIRSPVGAVGLMQLMPNTARLVAKKHGWRYQGTGSLTDPDTNIRYGSAYLKQLLGQFSNNRVLASAGYNAGPGRVLRWASHDGVRRDAGMYVENIPFLETRGYVQRVLLYTAIYEKLLTGRNVPVLTEAERNFSY